MYEAHTENHNMNIPVAVRVHLRKLVMQLLKERAQHLLAEAEDNSKKVKQDPRKLTLTEKNCWRGSQSTLCLFDAVDSPQSHYLQLVAYDDQFPTNLSVRSARVFAIRCFGYVAEGRIVAILLILSKMTKFVADNLEKLKHEYKLLHRTLRQLESFVMSPAFSYSTLNFTSNTNSTSANFEGLQTLCSTLVSISVVITQATLVLTASVIMYY